MAAKTVDRTFLQGQQSARLFRAAIKSQATRDAYERRLNGFLKRMNGGVLRCPDAFVEFAKNTRHLKFFAKEVLKEWN
jgi:hypothetical protein